MKVGDFKALEGIDFNPQLLASELDTSVSRMKYLSLEDCKSDYDIKAFNDFWNHIRNDEGVITSISESCDLYEIEDVCLITYEDLNCKIIIFDIQDSLVIEEMIKERQAE